MISTIAHRELRSLFVSSQAWWIAAGLQLLMAYLFLAKLDEFLQDWQGRSTVSEYIIATFYGNLSIVMLLVTPLLTMHTLSEERRSGRFVLLTSAPITMTQIVLGKYLGITGYAVIILLFLSLMPLSMAIGSDLDYWRFAGCLLGTVLLTSLFSAIGIMVSAFTLHPMVAAISSVGLLFLLWLLDWAGNTAGEATGTLLSYLSTLRHYETLLRGNINTGDIAYFIIGSGLALAIGIWQLRRPAQES